MTLENLFSLVEFMYTCTVSRIGSKKRTDTRSVLFYYSLTIVAVYIFANAACVLSERYTISSPTIIYAPQ